MYIPSTVLPYINTECILQQNNFPNSRCDVVKSGLSGNFSYM